jgi:hypothetical protein
MPDSCSRRADAKDSKIFDWARGLTLSGRMNEEHIAELEALIKSEAKGRRIALELKDLTLVGRDAISFPERCEADGITLMNCAGYVREWITRQRRGS